MLGFSRVREVYCHLTIRSTGGLFITVVISGGSALQQEVLQAGRGGSVIARFRLSAASVAYDKHFVTMMNYRHHDSSSFISTLYLYLMR